MLSQSELNEAVGTIKRFLELARPDRWFIHELDLNPEFLCTPEGIRSVIPFVTSAQEILAVSASALLRPE